jgi:hypothetical protein
VKEEWMRALGFELERSGNLRSKSLSLRNKVKEEWMRALGFEPERSGDLRSNIKLLLSSFLVVFFKLKCKFVT